CGGRSSTGIQQKNSEHKGYELILHEKAPLNIVRQLTLVKSTFLLFFTQLSHKVYSRISPAVIQKSFNMIAEGE
ncbi:MAG: hypothetical protein WAS72_08225, partial [Saprospiraceae bacterium]